MTIFKFKLITYEKRLIIFKAWSHNTSIFEIMIVASWYHCFTKRWLDLIKCTHCIIIVTFWMNFEKEKDFLNVHFKIKEFCSLASKILKTLKKQQEKNEFKTLQIASFKSISTIKSFVSKASLHTSLSTILFAKTSKSSIFDASSIFSFTFSHMQNLLNFNYEERLINFKAWSHQLFIFINLTTIDFWNKHRKLHYLLKMRSNISELKVKKKFIESSYTSIIKLLFCSNIKQRQIRSL